VPDALLDQYVDSLPSPQNAVNAVPGWNHALPPQAGAVVAGSMGMYPDARIVWGLEQFGAIAGCKVLELGPLEGLHTCALDEQQPEFVHAVEANKLAFLRCLVTKELMDLKRSKFLHGNFVLWLEHTPITYDLIVASGVLYHMSEPVRLLELMTQRANAILIWSHYFSEQAIPPGDPRRGAFTGEVKKVNYRGQELSLHRRGYHGAWHNNTFCGGMHDLHYWMEKDDIVAVLRLSGFDDIRFAHEQNDQPNGPSITIFARRTGA
jgi:hypothetical protein